jgi:hypothetical protein
MPVAGLVRADLRSDHPDVDLDAQAGDRWVKEIEVGVRQDAEPPSSPPKLGQCGRHLGKRRPGRERIGENIGFGALSGSEWIAARPRRPSPVQKQPG